MSSSDDDTGEGAGPRKTLRSIPTSRFARGFKMAKLTASVGVGTIADKMAGLLAESSSRELQALASQVKQAKKIADTLSQMKGAAMKLGQILSIHGEHLFPKEVVEVMARLQSQSDEMSFVEIEKVLKRELGDKLGTSLREVSPRPIASASIGQVHRAVARIDGEDAAVAVKVQYPGVDKSIDSDVDSLASLFTVLTRFPSAESFNAVTEEIKAVLRLETDYLTEGQSLEFFRSHFEKHAARVAPGAHGASHPLSPIVVPRYVPEVSTGHVLVSELVSGITVQEFAASTASQAARDTLGRTFLSVFYEEFFGLGKVQTDPNFANYKVKWSFGVQDPSLVLLDFGAVKTFDDEFRRDYRKLARACLDENYDGVRQASLDIGIMRDDDPKELFDMNYELAMMFTEPFLKNADYDWGASDLAERVRKQIPKFIFAFKLRPPPKDFIFLNRKIVGVYFFASAIKARFNPRPMLENRLKLG